MNEFVAFDQEGAAGARRIARSPRAPWADRIAALAGHWTGLAGNHAIKSAAEDNAALERALRAVERDRCSRALHREVDVALDGFFPDPVSGRWS